MGTLEDDEARRRVHEKLLRDPALRKANERSRQRVAAARRTRLHSFGLAGGRR
ncbi:hypothetical protein SEA_ROBINROSE_18 [Microbacterium phage RobinRose]|nr:hypothetical protein SEA_ROBINROSE_18 [Microbacterium phage RobinRose]